MFHMFCTFTLFFQHEISSSQEKDFRLALSTKKQFNTLPSIYIKLNFLFGFIDCGKPLSFNFTLFSRWTDAFPTINQIFLYAIHLDTIITIITVIMVVFIMIIIIEWFIKDSFFFIKIILLFAVILSFFLFFSSSSASILSNSSKYSASEMIFVLDQLSFSSLQPFPLAL